MAPQHIKPNPSSVRARFAHRFLLALKKMNHQKPTTARQIKRRYNLVKVAADVSIARAVGPRRAWSRALLWKIRNRAACRRHLGRRLRRNPRAEKNFGQAEELRRLVPGGETMDICSLLKETAHYIKCLTAQAKVMKNIVDFYSG